MNAYRITYVNPAFSPRASFDVVHAHNVSDAVRVFWENTNPAAVDKSIGDNGIVHVERLEGGAS